MGLGSSVLAGVLVRPTGVLPTPQLPLLPCHPAASLLLLSIVGVSWWLVVGTWSLCTGARGRRNVPGVAGGMSSGRDIP